MIPVPKSPATFLTKRFAHTLASRPEHQSLCPLDSMPITYGLSSRSAQEITLHPLLAWSTALPFLLWAGQEETQSDSGGTLVFVACCVIVIGIFSKTGWRNEAPR